MIDEGWDCKFVLAFAGDNPKYYERNEAVMKEFAAVGLDVLPFWSVRTPYDDVIERSIVHSRMCQGAYMNITLNHLRMVKTAYNCGARRALFFEDDIRFLKDRRLLGEIAADLPQDFDVALFDWVPRNKASDEELNAVLEDRASEYWVRFKDLRSCAAYGMSRRAMKRYIDILEAPGRGMGKLKICDQHFWHLLRDGDLRGYAALPCAGVQGVAGGATGYEDMWRRYGRFGIKRANYDD